MGKARGLLAVSPHFKASFRLLEALTTPQEKLLAEIRGWNRIGGGDMWIFSNSQCHHPISKSLKRTLLHSLGWFVLVTIVSEDLMEALGAT